MFEDSIYKCELCNINGNFLDSHLHLENNHVNLFNLDYDGIFVILAEVNHEIGFENDDDYTINKINPYWLYFSIYKHSHLNKIIDILKDKWLLCNYGEEIITLDFLKFSF